MGRSLKKKLKTIARKVRKAADMLFVGEKESTFQVSAYQAETDRMNRETDALDRETDLIEARARELSNLREQTAASIAAKNALDAETSRLKKQTAQTQYRTGMAQRATEAIRRRARAEESRVIQRLENRNILIGG